MSQFRHKLTGRTLRLIEETNGKGKFQDGDSTIICEIRYVTEGHEPLQELPVYPASYYVGLIPEKIERASNG